MNTITNLFQWLWWLIVIAAVVRLMSWADVGSRGECPVEPTLIPTIPLYER